MFEGDGNGISNQRFSVDNGEQLLHLLSQEHENIADMILALPLEAIIAVASTVIALCALWATLCQGWAIRKHNKLSLRPLLDAHYSFNKEPGRPYALIELVNAGIGPAIIKSYSLSFNDQIITENNENKFENFLTIHRKNFKFKRTWFNPNSVIAVDTKKILIGVHIQKNTPAERKKAENFINNIKINITYKSLYNKKYNLHISSFPESQHLRNRIGKMIKSCITSPIIQDGN